MKNLDVIQKEVERIRSDIKELQEKEEAFMEPVCVYLVGVIKESTRLYTEVKYSSYYEELFIHCYGNYSDKFKTQDIIYALLDRILEGLSISYNVLIYSKKETKEYYPKIYRKIKNE